VKIPIIGIGGIASWTDAIEFFIAGASAVQIGTANYYDPGCSMKVIDGLAQYCRNQGLSNITELVGTFIHPERFSTRK
jgi:dihydroorotate dehydrogenase (NAD+) catalytic subunit